MNRQKRMVPFIKNEGKQLVKMFPQYGRNSLCPCGSGKKMKVCHLQNVENAYDKVGAEKMKSE